MGAELTGEEVCGWGRGEGEWWGAAEQRQSSGRLKGKWERSKVGDESVHLHAAPCTSTLPSANLKHFQIRFFVHSVTKFSGSVKP